jgi:hypothetical protein
MNKQQGQILDLINGELERLTQKSKEPGSKNGLTCFPFSLTKEKAHDILSFLELYEALRVLDKT